MIFIKQRLMKVIWPIALYIENSFVRPKFRNPHFMYEENWLFMRRLSNVEWDEAVKKYGDPDDCWHTVRIQT